MDNSQNATCSAPGVNGTSSPSSTKGHHSEDYYKPFPPNYFAPKPGNKSLDVGIIGAGIAGLTAAVALVQSGHNVEASRRSEIFERSDFAYEIGAAIHMCPNATRLLSFYEFDFPGGLATAPDQFSLLDARTLEVLKNSDVSKRSHLYGAPWYLFHRVDLHHKLHELATEPRSNTKAVAKLHLSSEVKDIDLDGTITFTSGNTTKKDLLVVADGVRTRCAEKVVEQGFPTQANPTGTAVYRFLIPTEKLLADPQTRPLFDKVGICGSIARLEDARLVWYPCRKGALQNFGFFVADTIGNTEDEVWNIPASRQEFLKSCSALHPDLQAVCSKAENLKLFRLCMRSKPLPRLTKGRVVLIGDAAHPMLPHQAQGGAMAVEDGAALGVLFSDLHSEEDVGRRLELFQQLRCDRVSAVQIMSSVGQDEIQKVLDAARPYLKGAVPTTLEALNDYNFSPNILRDALELLQQDRGK